MGIHVYTLEDGPNLYIRPSSHRDLNMEGLMVGCFLYKCDMPVVVTMMMMMCVFILCALSVLRV